MKDLKSELLEQHAPLVHTVVKVLYKRLPKHIEYEDLVAAGMVGLLQAIERYSPAKGAKFKSFAEFRILGAIQDELRNMDVLSRSVRDKLRIIERVIHELGPNSTEAERIQASGLSAKTYRESIALSQAMHVPFDQPKRFEVRDKSALAAHIQSLGTPEGIDRLEVLEWQGAVMEAIVELREREREVILRYYVGEQTMSEIAGHFGITESRISQIIQASKAKLKTDLRKRGFQP